MIDCVLSFVLESLGSAPLAFALFVPAEIPTDDLAEGRAALFDLTGVPFWSAKQTLVISTP